ncbi:hypothetical protein [Thermoplasma volcanium]|nr:hypothetical protein [Thermoplasma volcanium]
MINILEKILKESRENVSDITDDLYSKKLDLLKHAALLVESLISPRI